MKARNTSSRIFAVAVLAAILIATAAMLENNITRRVFAFNPQPDPPAFGAFGITHEQSARLNVRIFVPESASASNERLRPLDIEFMFHDSQGNLIADLVQTVQPGHSAFLDLNGAEIPGSEAIRSELQPCIKILGNSNEPNKVQVIGSLEVFDNVGPDAGKSRMGWSNHNETLVRDTATKQRQR
jgi:hypothetical protein